MPYPRIDHRNLRLKPIKERENKMTLDQISPLGRMPTLCSLKSEAWDSIKALASSIVKSRLEGKPVIWMMGAHVLRRGNSRFIIDLMHRNIITHLASNFSAAIHDFELAYQGATLEDVEYYIKDGSFGNWSETLRFINQAIQNGYRDNLGMAEAIGRAIALNSVAFMPYREISIFSQAYALRIPATIHKEIGCDITDQYPNADFAAIGKTAGDDFLVFANSISQLDGGVFLNLGSQVVGPEVYLKALSIARNLADQDGKKISNFTSAVFDIVNLGDWRHPELVDFRKPGAMSDPRYYFRPLKTILLRTVADGGYGYYVQGDFNTTVPLLYHEVINQLDGRTI